MTYEGRDGVQLTMIVAEIVRERRRQDQSHGFIDLPDGTGGEDAIRRAELAKRACDILAESKSVTWADVFVEEVLEVLAESEGAKLRTELIQVAALCVKWVQWIDLRGK